MANTIKSVSSKSIKQKIQTPMAWHYTTGENFIKIVESGFLLPADVGMRYPEKPILWLSSNPYWEKTANKGTIKNGERVTLTMEETLLLGRGLVRFGVSIKALHHWDKLKKKSRINPSISYSLESVARKQGANPMQWYGTTKPLSVSKCLEISVMNKDTLEWENVEFNSNS